MTTASNGDENRGAGNIWFGSGSRNDVYPVKASPESMPPGNFGPPCLGANRATDGTGPGVLPACLLAQAPPTGLPPAPKERPDAFPPIPKYRLKDVPAGTPIPEDRVIQDDDHGSGSGGKTEGGAVSQPDTRGARSGVGSAADGNEKAGSPSRKTVPDDLRRLAREVEKLPLSGGWREIPNTVMPLITRDEMRRLASQQGKPGADRFTWGNTGSSSVLSAWNSAAFDGRRWWFHGGGHADYGGNEVYQFDFSSLEWTRLTDPEILAKPDMNGKGRARCPLPTYGPGSSHTYGAMAYTPKTGSVWYLAANAYCWRDSTGQNQIWEFQPDTGIWTRHGRHWLKGDARAKIAVDPRTGNLIVFDKSGASEYDPVLGKVRARWTAGASGNNFGMAIFAADKRIALETGWGFVRSLRIDAPGSRVRILARWPKGLNYQAGVTYDSARSRPVFWQGGRSVWTLDIGSAGWAKFPRAAGRAPIKGAGRPYAKWVYLAEFDVFAGIDNPKQGIWLYRPPRQQPAAARE